MPHQIAHRAPGRVNLIGEHTDYSGGLALPMAIDRDVRVVGRPAQDIELRSDRFDGVVRLPPDGSQAPEQGWGRYVAAVAAELALAGRAPVGLHGVVTSTVPDGAGLSSSAALEVAVALSLCAAADLDPDREDLALLLQRAEQRAVGLPVGVLDQAACLLTRAGAALLLDCETLEHEHVPVPDSIVVLVIDSNTPRQLEGSGYATRRAELEAALPVLDGRNPKHVAPSELDAVTADLPALNARRLRHVVTENARVRETVALLRAPQVDLDTLGAVFRASHDSLRHDYEVTTPELDTLVEQAMRSGAHAARMTGGGFGGAIVALVDQDAAEDVGARTAAEYARLHPDRQATVHRCRPADAAGPVAV